MGKLYVIGTPIGNLGDISPRAIETLRKVDFIAAEDTRVSIKLLQKFEIKKPLISYHEHNMRQRGGEILERISGEESCAIITDAGMPCISDPGVELVKLCAQAGIEVIVVPGPSAVVSALAVSGLPTGRFSFEGFLSIKRSSRFEHLQSVKRDPRTLVFYEAPHKLPAALRDMLEVLGDRNIALARELTKIHEEVWRTTLSEAAAYYLENPPRGEFVLVIEGAKEIAKSVTLDEAVRLALQLREEGKPISQAAKEAAKETGQKKGDIYRVLLAKE